MAGRTHHAMGGRQEPVRILRPQGRAVALQGLFVQRRQHQRPMVRHARRERVPGRNHVRTGRQDGQTVQRAHPRRERGRQPAARLDQPRHQGMRYGREGRRRLHPRRRGQSLRRETRRRRNQLHGRRAGRFEEHGRRTRARHRKRPRQEHRRRRDRQHRRLPVPQQQHQPRVDQKVDPADPARQHLRVPENTRTPLLVRAHHLRRRKPHVRQGRRQADRHPPHVDQGRLRQGRARQPRAHHPHRNPNPGQLLHHDQRQRRRERAGTPPFRLLRDVLGQLGQHPAAVRGQPHRHQQHGQPRNHPRRLDQNLLDRNRRIQLAHDRRRGREGRMA